VIYVVGHTAIDHICRVRDLPPPNGSVTIIERKVLFGGGAANIAAGTRRAGIEERGAVAVHRNVAGKAAGAGAAPTVSVCVAIGIGVSSRVGKSAPSSGKNSSTLTGSTSHGRSVRRRGSNASRCHGRMSHAASSARGRNASR